MPNVPERMHHPSSPVPGDQNLWPGELPFTAFGQWGPDKLDLRVFDQDIWWVDRLGRPHVIEDMPDDYRRNVIAFLVTFVHEYHAASALRWAMQAYGDALLGEVGSEVLLAELGQPTCGQLDPHDWLEGTPLMRKFRRVTGVTITG